MKMPESGSLASEGAKVVLATSCDENHPPENIIDGRSETFWVSTGLFPQEFIISFPSPKTISTLHLDCYNDRQIINSGNGAGIRWTETVGELSVKRFLIERSTDTDPVDFKPLQDEKDLPVTDNQLMKEEVRVSNVQANHLRVSILSGHDHFVSIHRLHING